MCRKSTYLVLIALALSAASGPVVGGVSYKDPPGGWRYIFNGDAAASPVAAALDGTWDHYDAADGGSDAWDGSGIGAGLPGGVGALVEGDAGFLRIQDVFSSDPGAEPSNRKIYFGHNITITEGAPADLLDSGVTVSFRVRISTTPPLDNVAGGGTPWLAGGDGYVGHDNGKGNFGIRAGNDKIISFCLSLASDHTFLGGKQGLTMNSRSGTTPGDLVDIAQSEGTLNILEVADLKAWHEFFINIKADTSGGGTHLVKIWMDGSMTPTEFHVTAGTANETNYAAFGYLALGCGNTGQAGAFDTDFFAYKPGLYVPGGENKAWGPAPHNTTVDADFVSLTWSAGASAALHDVYCGTSLIDVNAANSSDPMGADEVYKARQSGTKYPPGSTYVMPLTRGKTYYWRIDEVNDFHADKLWRGDIWSFDVKSSLNYDPDPPDQETFVLVTTDNLSWKKGTWAKVCHIIYLSTDFNDVNDAVPGTENGPAWLGTTLSPIDTSIEIPGDLDPNTTYYWRADPVEEPAPSLKAHKGAVWSFTTGPTGAGTILREIWQGMTANPGTAISLLYDWPDFPYNPTTTDTLTSFVSDPDWDDYGGRIHGWVYAPVSGDYRFYLTSDDNGQLWLSTDHDAANARLIASETGARTLYNWPATGEEVSALIPLVGGQKYYISALWKERAGGDHCAVGWTVPGATTITVIPDRYLMPYVQYWAHDPMPADKSQGVSTTPTLTWLPGVCAASHNVYFGTSYAEVKAGAPGTLKPSQPLGDTDYVPSPALTAGKAYYWKITEVNDAHPDQRWEGPVWVFRVAGGTGGLLGAYYQHTGGAAPAGFETFKLSRIDPEINFDWVIGSPDPLVDVNDFSCRWTGLVETQFSEDYTFYTASDDGARLWVDGQLVIDRWVDQGTTEWASPPIALVAGQKYDIIMEQYENEGGASAYLRWSSPSTSKRIIPSFWLLQPTKAANPMPPNGSTSAPLKPTLSWTAGVYAAAAAGHRVYFDADEHNVTIRTGCQVNGVSTTTPSYGLLPTFGLEETYYWAVDEVNNLHPDHEWRGDTWSFTTTNNKFVDDFETYEDKYTVPAPLPEDVNWIYFVYTDGFGDLDCTEGSGNGSGAKIGDLWRSGHDGSSLAMTFLYDNDGRVKTPHDCNPLELEVDRAYYSKVEALVAKLPSGIGSDWTLGGVTKVLSLWFHGDPSNVVDPDMWVQLTDSSNNKAKVFYGKYADEDINDMNEASWHEWLIDLEDFNVPPTPVKLTDVNSIAIGVGDEDATSGVATGTLYFDDIRLYTPICVLTRRATDFAALDYVPAGNPAGDCVINARELEIMTRDWLMTDTLETSELLVQWAFNDASGLIAADSSGKGRTGAISAGTTWVNDPERGWCLDFNDGDFVLDNDASAYMNGLRAFTVSCWIKATTVGSDHGFIIFQTLSGNDERDIRYDAAGSSTGGTSLIKCGITSTDGSQQYESASGVQTTFWQHVAMTWSAGNDLELYINGVPDATGPIDPTRGGTSTGYTQLIVGKGGKDEAANAGWNGLIDDVRIYNFALTDAEIATVKAGGSVPSRPLHIPTPSPAEIGGDEAQGSMVINFKDYAVLTDRWLDEDFFP